MLITLQYRSQEDLLTAIDAIIWCINDDNSSLTSLIVSVFYGGGIMSELDMNTTNAVITKAITVLLYISIFYNRINTSNYKVYKFFVGIITNG